MFHKCSVDGCEKPVRHRSWCKAHYTRWWKHGDPLGGLFKQKAGGPCSTEGCPNVAVKRGLCGKHYIRWRKHGDPTHVDKTPNGEAQRWIEEVVLNYTGTDCLEWPYAKTFGYGRCSYEGKDYVASRLVCMLVHGQPPTPKHEAAHSCGNGSKGCVNPGHLKWATRAENEADKIDHGTSNRGERSGNAKLTNEEAVEIKRLLGVTKLSQKRIAQSFGVSATTVHEIASGKRWAWLSEGDFK